MNKGDNGISCKHEIQLNNRTTEIEMMNNCKKIINIKKNLKKGEDMCGPQPVATRLPLHVPGFAGSFLLLKRVFTSTNHSV